MSLARTIKLNDVKCPECGNKFETSKTEKIQCSECGKRFDL